MAPLATLANPAHQRAEVRTNSHKLALCLREHAEPFRRRVAHYATCATLVSEQHNDLRKKSEVRGDSKPFALVK